MDEITNEMMDAIVKKEEIYDEVCTIIADYKAEIAEAEGESAFTRECIRKRAFAKILELFGGEEE